MTGADAIERCLNPARFVQNRYERSREDPRLGSHIVANDAEVKTGARASTGKAHSLARSSDGHYAG